MRAPIRPEAHDSLLDFETFVATSRGISSREAEKLIADWMREYRPLARTSQRSGEEARAHAG